MPSPQHQPLTGFFREDDGDTIKITSVESIAERLDKEHLRAGRVLTKDEVTDRSRVFTAILNEPGPVTRTLPLPLR